MAGDLAVLLGRKILYVLIWSSLFIYTWYTIVFCLPTWSRQTDGTWSDWRSTNNVKYHTDGKDNETLLSGSDLQAIVLWWFPMMVAVLCTYIVSMLPAASYSSDVDPSAFMMVKRVLSWQLYPRKFWLYWCDGLTVAEFGGVCLWVVVHCVGLWNYVEFYHDRYAQRMKQGSITKGVQVKQSVMYLDWVALSFGWLSFIDFAFLFLPISRNGFLSLLTGLPFASLIRYHRWIGHSTLWMIALHAIFFFSYWSAHPGLSVWEQFSDFGKHENVNVLAGAIAFFFGLALWMTSFNFVRRNFFEVFYKTHMVGFLGFISFGMIHYSGMWRIFSPGLVLYAADYVVRIVQGASVLTVEASHVSDRDQVAVVELPAQKGFSLCPVQDIFLLFPSISRWQWHPFTVMARKEGTDPSHPGSVTVAMKSYGSWTKEALHQLSHSQYPIPIRVNGAFDGFSVNELRGCDHLLMLGGGIGATPLIAVVTEIQRRKAAGDAAVARLQHVQFLWVARTMDELRIIPENVLGMSSSEPWFSLHLYYTGKEPIDAKSGVKVTDMKQLPDDANSSSASSSTALGNIICPVSTTEGTYKFRHASPFFWNTARPAEPYGHCVTLLTVLVAFLGAFLGLVIAMACDVEWTEKHKDTNYIHAKQNVLTLMSIVVQTIGLPMMLVILPRHYYLSWTTAPLPADKPRTVEVAAVQADGRIAYLESDLSSAVTSGRPDIPAILRDMVDNGKAEQVCVYCAGPAALLNSTALTVWDLNDRRLAGQPYIDFKKYSYEL